MALYWQAMCIICLFGILQYAEMYSADVEGRGRFVRSEPEPENGTSVGEPEPENGTSVGEPEPENGTSVGEPEPENGTSVGEPEPEAESRPSPIEVIVPPFVLLLFILIGKWTIPLIVAFSLLLLPVTNST